MFRWWRYCSLIGILFAIFHCTQAESLIAHRILRFGKRSVDDQSFIDSEDKRTGSGLQSLLGNDDTNVLKKKAGEGHNLLRFGKRSRDDEGRKNNFLHFGKREEDDNTDKRTYNQLLHFGKRDERPGHSLMRFGKRQDGGNEDLEDFDKRGHSLMHFGKRQEDGNEDQEDLDKRGHSLMHFGKRQLGDREDIDDFDKRGGHNLLHFGKREVARGANTNFGDRVDDLELEKRQNKFIHFGKRDNKIMRFGKREGEGKRGHNLLHFGKRDPIAEDEEDVENKRAHSLLHFGKKGGDDGPRRSHSLMHFGKREATNFDGGSSLPKQRPVRSAVDDMSNAEMLDVLKELYLQQREGSKRGHTIMRFGKRGGDSHSIMRFGKRFLENGDDDDEAYSQDSSAEEEDLENVNRVRQLPYLPKRGGSHTHMHFGKRDDVGHRILSFGKRFYDDYDDLDEDLLETEDSQLDNALDTNDVFNPEDTLEDQFAGDADKRISHSMIHFGKRGNAMLHFGKRGGGNAMLHFGKRREGNAMLHFGKRDYESRDPQDVLLDDLKRAHNILHFGKREAPSTIPNSSFDSEVNDRTEKNSNNKIQSVEHTSTSGENNTQVEGSAVRQRRSIDEMGDGYGYQEWNLDTHHPSFLIPRAFSTAEINPFQVPLFLSSLNHIQRAAYPFYRSSRAADKKKNVFLHFGRR